MLSFSALEHLVIVVPSEWLADRARQSFLKKKDIRVVHNGIDTENVFYPRTFEHLKKRHHLADEKVILAVAPNLMESRKGGRWVLKLAEKLAGENVKFILIGVDDLTESFPPNVIALGRTENQQELAEYYSMADCFVICSEMESFSMTCAESLCCGTPVVGFRSGAPETVFLPPTAEFCDHGDVDALSGLVRDMLETPPPAAAFDGVHKHYSKRRMYEEYRGIYEEILGANSLAQSVTPV